MTIDDHAGERQQNPQPDQEVIGPPLALEEKVDFLSRAGAYPERPSDVIAHETHMSWVFLAGDKAYKLKKPVRFPYLDFSTLEKREAVCRAEMDLNRRLAPDVYLGVRSLRLSPSGLSIGGAGVIVDWLVEMRRLDSRLMLDQLILHRQVTADQTARLLRALVAFYRKAPGLRPWPAEYLACWRKRLSENRALLFDPRFSLPPAPLRRIDRVQRRFLAQNQALFAARIKAGRIVHGHGDLRPEHVWLGHPLAIIDCLEFNAALRTLDPFDEIAYFGIECERLGGGRIGRRLEMGLVRLLGDKIPAGLFSFYRCYRATLKAKLSLAHLLEQKPRTPEKWLPLARVYLQIAEREAIRLERSLQGASIGRRRQAGCFTASAARSKKAVRAY